MIHINIGDYVEPVNPYIPPNDTPALGDPTSCRNCLATRWEYDRDPCTRATCPVRDSLAAPSSSVAVPPGPFCNNQYERIGGRQPGDRIVECGRPLGHEDDHHEYVDGKVANAWPNAAVAVPPAEPPDDADDPWWVARGEYQKAMDEADRLTVEAAGITAAAEAAWLAFARGYLKERKVDHA